MHLGDVMKNIQTNLLSAFESSGLTYDELAKRTNLPKSALYRYINGDTEKIPIDRFQSICYELKVDASSLLGWKDLPPQDPVSDVPATRESRIISEGIDRMPKERREQALRILQAAFSEYADFFKEEDNDT